MTKLASEIARRIMDELPENSTQAELEAFVLKHFGKASMADMKAALAIMNEVERQDQAEEAFAERRMIAASADEDEHDGTLFRFWIRAASDFPAETANALAACLTPDQYRRALTDLAERKRINLPQRSTAAAVLQQAGKVIGDLRGEVSQLKSDLIRILGEPTSGLSSGAEKLAALFHRPEKSPDRKDG